MPRWFADLRLTLLVLVMGVLAAGLSCQSSVPSSPTSPSTKKDTIVATPPPSSPDPDATAPPAKPATPPPPGPAPTTIDSLTEPAVPGIYELLLFHPSQYPYGDWNPQQLEFEDVWMTSPDGTKLHGWYCPAEDAHCVLLYAHGNAGNISTRAGLLRLLQESLHVSVLAFDYRGYGRSDGTPSIAGALADARTAHAELARLANVPPRDIVLMGKSLGGAIVIQLAADVEPRGLVVESTFSSLRDVAEVHYRQLAALVPPDVLDNVERIDEYTGPLLYSHGTADGVIPFELGQRLFAAANQPKTLIELAGADHNTPRPASYYQTLQHFLTTLPPVSDSQVSPDVRP